MKMAATESSLRYSIEVRSRFSAFLDDPSTDVDPTILLSRIKESRTKEKRAPKEQKVTNSPVSEPKEEASVVTESSPDAEVEQPLVSPHAHEEYHPRGRGYRGGFPFRGPSVPRGPPRNYNYNPEQENEHFGYNPDYNRGYRGRGRGYGMRNQRYRGGSDRKQVSINDSVHSIEQSDISNGPTELDAKENEPHAENDVEEIKPEEPKVQTLQEYKAKQAAKMSVELATKSVRAPNDGKDVFANMVPHQKSEQIAGTASESVVRQRQSQVSEDFSLDVTYNDRVNKQQSFNRRGNSSGFRGPRGTGFGRGTRRGRFPVPTSNHSTVPAPPSINDDQEFPSLSK